MANNDKENKIKKFTKEAIGKTLNQFNKEIGIADLVEINKNQDRMLNGILSQINDESTEKTEKSNIITLDNSTDGIVELKEIQGDTNVNVSKIEEMPITHDIGDKEGNVFTLNEIPKGAISIGEIQGNTMVNCNKDDEKELVLMKDLSTQGDNNITLTEGVDGGKVDVALEGNTMVNVCDQKDPVAITKSYTVETGNHVALQGEYDGKCRPVVTGNTLVNLSEINTATLSPSNTMVSTGISMLKPSTTYTSILNIKTNTLSPGDGTSIVGALYVDNGNNQNKIELGYTGVIKSIFTTNSDISSYNFTTRVRLNSSPTEGSMEVEEILLEGDYTNKPIPEYFEGLQSSFEDKVVPESLAGINNFVAWAETYGDDIICPIFHNDSIKRSLKMYAGKTYTIIRKGVWKNVNYAYYDANNNYIQGDISSLTYTPTEDGYFQIYFYGTLDDRNEQNLEDLIIFEGDYTNYDFSDYDPTNAGKYEVSYVVTGKNKLNMNDVSSTNGYTFENGILTTSNHGTWGGDIPYIKVYLKANVTYRFSANNLEGDYVNSIWKDNKKIIDKFGMDGQTANLNEDGYYLLAIGTINNGIQVKLTNIQLEEGTEATPYEPYKEYKKTFYLNSPLLEGDTIEQQGDNVVHVHRYGKVVLDGSEDEGWTNLNTGGLKLSEKAFMSTRIDLNHPIINIGDKYEDIDLCNNLRTMMWWSMHYPTIDDVPDNIISYVNWQTQNVFWVVHKTTPSLDEFKTWLQQNPVKVVYKLTTPQYEVISQNDTILCDSYINGHLDVDSVIPIKRVNFMIAQLPPLKYVYEKTKYTLQFESDNVGKIDYLIIGQETKVNIDVIKGLNKINITTASTSPYIDFRGIGFNASNIVVTEAIAQDFGYFEGMKSVGECEGNEIEILSRGINEFDIDNTIFTFSIPVTKNTDGTINISGDTTGYWARDSMSYTIEVKAGETIYFLAFCDSGINYDKGGANFYVNGIHMGNPDVNSVYKRTISEDATIKITFFPTKGSSNAGKYEYNNLKLGIFRQEVAEWTPYKSNKKQILMNEPLRAVGDIKDKYVLIDGKWYIERKCGVRAYQEGDIDNYITDMINTVYPLSTPTYEPIDYNPFTVYSEVTHISNNSTIPCNMTIKNTGYNCLLKPSTTYTVSSNLGLNTVTTPSTLTEDCLRFYDTDTSTVTKMNNVMVLEGDYTTNGKPLPSHFSGIESAFEQEYDEAVGKYKIRAKVVGKNLLNFDDNSLVNILNDRPLFRCGFEFKQEGTFTLSIKNLNDSTIFYKIRTNGIVAKYYSVKDKVTVSLDKDQSLVVYSADENVKFSDLGITNIQLEQGTEATPYEPYKESIIEFYIDEPLRGIGDVKDKIYVKNDKVVVERNCGSVTFDGSETIEKWPTSNNCYLININKNMKYTQFGIFCLCDTLKAYNSVKLYDGALGIGNDEKNIIINLNKDDTYIKQWLQQNPTTVVYQLATPTYEEVEYSESRLFLNTYNNSTLFYESNIPVSNTSFKPLWEELVYLKNSTRYYIQFNSTASGTVVFNLGGTEVTKDIVEGYNNIAIDTPAETTNLLTIDGHGIKISEVVVSESVCGGHYLGLQSCFEEHMENGKYVCTIRGIALDGSKVNGIKLYINEPLRGIEGIKDRLCIKDGKLMVERKCGEIIINETNPYSISSNNPTYPSVLRIWLNSSNIPNVKNGKVLCNTLPCYVAMNKDVIGIACDYGFDIHLPLPTTSTIDEAREYLKNNPLKVVYQLTEPIYEEVTNEYGLPIVFEGYENGIVYIDSVVTPTTHIKYTSNNQLATTLSEAEEQNIATQEDINMNVITYMMDIDMMLTDMEMSNDISVMAVRRDSSNENMLDRMSDEDKKVYRDNTVVMLEKMITANVLEKEDIEGRIDMYYNKNRISKEQYKYLKSLL